MLPLAAGPYRVRRPCVGLRVRAGFLAVATAAATHALEPVDVDVPAPPLAFSETVTVERYAPTEAAGRRWRVCAAVPHTRSSFWRGVAFGLLDESQRLGVALRLYVGAGYGAPDVQVRQLRRCIEGGADALVVASVAEAHVLPLVDAFRARGRPVVDLINPMTRPSADARVYVSPWQNAQALGRYLVDYAGGRALRGASLPGPSEAGWAREADGGLRTALRGSLVRTVVSRFGDTEPSVQRRLVEEVLTAEPKLDFLIGNGMAAVEAVYALRERGLQDQVAVFSWSFDGEVYREIRRGNVVASATSLQVVQARIAVDQAVRLLEGRELRREVRPQVSIVDADNIDAFDGDTARAPYGFRLRWLARARAER